MQVVVMTKLNCNDRTLAFISDVPLGVVDGIYVLVMLRNLSSALGTSDSGKTVGPDLQLSCRDFFFEPAVLHSTFTFLF